jgi:hypothetical protein
MVDPIPLAFTLEPGMSDSEIETLWNQTLAAQEALDAFLAGEFTEAEMTDLLSANDVSPEETAQTLENNLIYLGVL